MDFLVVSYLLSGFVIGLICFQSFIVAPTVFTLLSKDNSKVIIRAIFPKLFKTLIIIGIIMLILCYLSEKNILLFSTQLVSSSATILLPTICLIMVKFTNNAADKENVKLFKLYHTLSVIFILIVLILNIIWPFL